MASMEFENNARSTVADYPLAAGATTLNVASGEGANFPSSFPFILTVWDAAIYPNPGDDPGMEIVKCTGGADDALTIVRGEEDTADVDHAFGERVAMLWTAGHFNDAATGIVTRLDTIETFIDQSVISGASPTFDGVNITNIDADTLIADVKEANVSAVTKGQMCAIVGSSGAKFEVQLCDCDNANLIRVLGLVVANTAQNETGQVVYKGLLTNVNTQITNTDVNPNGETWTAGDLLYVSTTPGGLTNVRPSTGRCIKAGRTLKGNSASDTLLAIVNTNSICACAAAGEDICSRMGDNDGVNKHSFKDYANNEVAAIDSNGNLTLIGNIDGRDVSVDGTKLDNLAKSATVVVGKSGAVDYLTTDYASDDLAIQAAIDYVKTLSTGGGVVLREGAYTIANTITWDLGLKYGCSFICGAGAYLVPTAGIGNCLEVINGYAPTVNIRIVGGGEWTTPDQGLFIRGVRGGDFYIYAKNYLGRVCRCTTETGIEQKTSKLKFISFETESCGQSIYVDCSSAFGEFISVYWFWDTYGPHFLDTADILFGTIDGGFQTNHGIWFEGCTSVRAGIVSVGDETHTVSLLKITGSTANTTIAGYDFGSVFVLHGKIGVELENIRADSRGIVFGKIESYSNSDYGLLATNCRYVNANLFSYQDGVGLRFAGTETLRHHYNVHITSAATNGIEMVGTYSRISISGDVAGCNTSSAASKYEIYMTGTIGAAGIDFEQVYLEGATTTQNLLVPATNNLRIFGGYISTISGTPSRMVNLGNHTPKGNFTAPSVPATTVNYTNAYGYPCQVQVYGGTVTEIDIDDIATGLTSGIFIIPPGETINITYSAAPSWRWWGL